MVGSPTRAGCRPGGPGHSGPGPRHRPRPNRRKGASQGRSRASARSGRVLRGHLAWRPDDQAGTWRSWRSPPRPASPSFVRLPTEVEPRLVLEFEASFLAVRAATNDNQRGGEADHLEIPAKFVGVPDLAVLGFKGFSASRLGIQFDQPATPDVLGGVVQR